MIDRDDAVLAQKAEIVRLANLLVTAQGRQTVDLHWKCPVLVFDFENVRIFKKLLTDKAPEIVIFNHNGTVLKCDLPMSYEDQVRTTFEWGPASMDPKTRVCLPFDRFIEAARQATLLDELGATQD